MSWEKRAAYLHEMLLRLAADRDDQPTLAALRTMKPPFWADVTQRTNLDRISREYIRGNRPPPLASILAQPLTPNWTLAERAAAQQGGAKSSERFLPEVYRFDAASLGDRFDIPVALVQGEDDHHTPTPVARRWLNGISAPKKGFTLVLDGRHTILTSHRMETLRALERTLRPWGLAGGAPDPAGFESLTGRYALSPALTLNVVRRDDKLLAQTLGQTLELQPEGGRTFLIQEFDALVAFEPGAEGRASGLTLSAPDLEIRAPRTA